MTSINSDFMSQLALRSLGKSSNMMTQAMERLSTGKRINSASDDAAGLGIATKLKAQVSSLNAASRNTSDALALIGTIDGALEESQEILLRMRELAVQSASDSNTGTDRTFIQDEINQLTAELNRISSATEFNSVKLLDGTYNDKSIQIGTGPNQTFKLGINATDAATLGAYELQSTTEALAADSGTTMGAVGTHASAKSGLNDLFNVAADYVVKGSFGTKTANVEAGADARDVAKAFNLISGTTGVQANAVTRAKISAITGADTYSFTLQGKSTTASTVNATIASISNLTELKDAINAVSGSTGITAALTEDLAGINLVQNEGYDIIIGDVTAATTHSAVTFDTSSPPASSAGATLTSGSAHGFSVGDVVKYAKGGTVVTGLTDGAFYRVSSVASTTTMTLTTTDGEDVTYGGGGGHAGDTFTKVNTIDVKTVSKSNTTGLLVDGGITTLGTATTDDSMAIAGQVSLSSHKAFTVTPGNAANHFNATTNTVTASLKQIGDVDVSSQLGATNALSVIDGAIAMTSEVRSEIGAANNRLEATADNLTNISVNIQRSLSSVEDANFASETSALTKAQILQQAATSMLAQANQAKQSMLVLLQG
jgi:flagellin